jgi:hypothetical protein
MISLHYGAILISAIAVFFVGWVWYSPLLFQKPWRRMSGLPEQAKGQVPSPLLMLIGFGSYLVLGATLDALFQIIGVGTLMVAWKIALLCWLGFVATLTLGIVTWEQKSWKLYLLHNGYHLISFLIIASILFALQ